MKKFFSFLLVLVLVAALGGLGYAAYVLLSEEGLGEAAQANASSSQGGKGSGTGFGSASINQKKEEEKPSGADILSSIAYEKEQNRDTVGWLIVPGTDINNSVVQGFDNSYYLRRTERKEDDIYGCYFADYNNAFGTREELSTNTVIYGHSDLTDSPDGPKFSQLFRFTDQQFAKEHPVISFSTQEDLMDWQIVAVYYTDLNLDFTNTEYDPAALAQEAAARSIWNYGVPVTSQDKLLSLVTCTVKYGAEEKDQRLVILAKLLPEGENSVKLDVLEANPNPQQPVFN